jgi:putative transposase
MARRPRARAVTGYYHVVNRAMRKQTLFRSRRDYIAFLAVLRAGLERHEAPLVAYCVLSNHWHLLVGPIEKVDLSRVVKWVSATHAIRWHRFRGTTGTGPVYQGRFRSTPIHELESLMPLTRYVERNARSAGLVARAEEWRWCSLSQRLRGSRTVPLSAARLLSSDLWVDYVNAIITPREQAREHGKIER